MSGTSLDGLDLALCAFDKKDDSAIQWRLLAADTVPYPDEWVDRLSSLEEASAYNYALANVRLGRYFGQQVALFRQRHDEPVDAVASHGHTIFHQPHLGLTTQIGDGDALAAESGLPVVFNFRTLDVALGGQGAPLVPIGDQLLFGSYGACLNLGGIANISFSNAAGNRVGYDICPCNMALNALSRQVGRKYDKDGIMASCGRVLPELMYAMEALPFYAQPAPKSLGKEWFVDQFLPLISDEHHPVADRMRTAVQHIASRIAAEVRAIGAKSLLVTGGGAKNKFLIQALSDLLTDCRVVVPEDDIIDYKEAIVFALLGYLRLAGLPNCLPSVTGASRPCVGGCVSGLLG